MLHLTQTTRLLLLVSLGLMLFPLSTQAQTLLTPSMQALVAHAKLLASTQCRIVDDAGSKDAAEGFVATMDALGAQMTPDLARQCALREGNDMDAKLALIAWDRRQRPELYQELENRYVYSINSPMAHAPQSPTVLPKHATEEYRLAWEYLMIAPSNGGAPQADIRIVRAITEIHNEASFTTYRLAFAISSDPKLTDPEYTRNSQQLWLGSLGMFQDSAALRTILDCITMAQNQMAHQEKYWDPAQYVREEVVGQMYHPADNLRWKAIIAALPKAALASQHTSFLNTVLARIATNPDIPPGLDPAPAADLRAQQAVEIQKVRAEIAQMQKGQTTPAGATQPAP